VGCAVNYQDAAFVITHKHDLARCFETQTDAQDMANQLNVGRPEGLNPFRVESCPTHNFHVRRGANVFVKVTDVR
jgi:hypothetical protein